MELKGKKFIVTGGAGFIGSHVVDQLVASGVEEIVVVDNLERGKRENLKLADRSNITFIETDINNKDELLPYFKGVDGCFHLAGLRITQCAADPQKAFDSMVAGTFSVVELCRKQGVSKIVFSSTASVYGMADEFPTRETHHPWNNDTLYGATKVFGEGLLRSYHQMFGLDYVALRYFNAYGPRMDAFGKYTEVMIRWMECMEEGRTPKIFGDGKQTMDFVYVEDIARANILAMKADIQADVFNIASGQEHSLNDLMKAMASAYGQPDLQAEHLEERKVNPVPRRLASIEKAGHLLGYSPEVDFQTGINRLVQWYKDIVNQKVG